MKKSILALISIFIMIGCQSTKTVFLDQFAYQKTIEIKTETDALLDKATTPYNQNLQEIGDLLQDIQFITEYEKNRPNNQISHTMWKMLGDKDKNLIVGFLQQWQRSSTVSSAFIPEAKEQINEALDLLIQYEMKKDKTSEQNLLNYINQ